VQGADAMPQTLSAQGNLDSKTLAGALGRAQTLTLQTAAPLTPAALAGWGRAQQLRSGLARVRGHMRFQGSALARVGGQIAVRGVGARFEGKAFVGAIEHEIAEGNWLTRVDFGLDPQWFCERPDVMAPRAGARLPGASGLQIGIVRRTDPDPAGEYRVQVELPVLRAEQPLLWARLVQLHASSGFGTFFLPEIGDEVIVAFVDDDPNGPVVLGSLYSSGRKPPYAPEAGNDVKAIVTRSKHKLEFDEKDKVVTLTTPANNRVVLSDRDQSIRLADQNGNKVLLDPGGITIDTTKDLKLTAKGSITIDAVGPVTIASKADVEASGLNVACQAQVGFTGKGGATAELSADGQTTVKGALVRIN
jgi:uncharacterized protein involved in type VI secretion and phage assembly